MGRVAIIEEDSSTPVQASFYQDRSPVQSTNRTGYQDHSPPPQSRFRAISPEPSKNSSEFNKVNGEKKMSSEQRKMMGGTNSDESGFFEEGQNEDSDDDGIEIVFEKKVEKKVDTIKVDIKKIEIEDKGHNVVQGKSTTSYIEHILV